jgi:hypothetical protein
MLESDINSNEESRFGKNRTGFSCYIFVRSLTAVDDSSGQRDDWKDAKKVDDAQSGENKSEAAALLRQHLPRRAALLGEGTARLPVLGLALQHVDQQGHRLVVLRVIRTHASAGTIKMHSIFAYIGRIKQKFYSF